MRHRVERVKCPVCRNSPALRSICTGCMGKGQAVVVHMPGGSIEVYDLDSEARLRQQYPDAPTPVHERTTVDQAWEKLVDEIEIRHAHPMQLREMKRAFFAGTWWMLEVLSIQMDPQGEPTADDLEYLQRISDEIQHFNEAIQEGRA